MSLTFWGLSSLSFIYAKGYAALLILRYVSAYEVSFYSLDATTTVSYLVSAKQGTMQVRLHKISPLFTSQYHVWSLRNDILPELLVQTQRTCVPHILVYDR